MSITSSEVNYLIYRYLTESGYDHSAFTFFYESGVDKTIPGIQHKDVPLGMLVSVLQKGLQYHNIETHVQPDGSFRPCNAPFSLLKPHKCSEQPAGSLIASPPFSLASSQQPQQSPSQQQPSPMPLSSSAPSSSPNVISQQQPQPQPQP